MYTYKIGFDSISGDSHDIEIKHEQKMDNDELLIKLVSIAESLDLDYDNLDYRNSSEFQTFLNELPIHGFQFANDDCTAYVHISKVASTIERKTKEENKIDIFEEWTREWKWFLEENKIETKKFFEEELHFIKDLQFKHAEKYGYYNDKYGWEVEFILNRILINFSYANMMCRFIDENKNEVEMLKGKEKEFKDLLISFGIEEKIQKAGLVS